MENKTAMQELLEKIHSQRDSGNTDLRTTIFHANRLLNVEKEQIFDAYVAGEDNGSHPHPVHSAESYYNETYGKG